MVYPTFTVCDELCMDTYFRPVVVLVMQRFGGWWEQINIDDDDYDDDDEHGSYLQSIPGL